MYAFVRDKLTVVKLEFYGIELRFCVALPSCESTHITWWTKIEPPRGPPAVTSSLLLELNMVETSLTPKKPAFMAKFSTYQ